MRRSSRWATPSRVAIAGGGQRHHEDIAVDLGDHQPVRGRFGGVEHGIGYPHLVDVVDAQVRVFEQVSSLGVNLERILVIEEIEIKQPVRHASDCITNGCSIASILCPPRVPLACH